MAHWVGAQGQVQLAQNAKILPHFDVIPRKLQTQNKKKCFLNLN